MQQLLWLETVLKLTAGLTLAIAPLTAIRAFGLPPSANGFWPRLLGMLLIGLAGAIYIEGAWGGSRGLGVGGLVIINVTTAAALALLATFGGGSGTRRGNFALWAAAALLFLLALVEIAHA